MKTVLLMLVLLTMCNYSSAQKKQSGLYGNFSLIFNKIKYPGAGLVVGYRINQYIGIGAGVEGYSIDSFSKVAATPFFGEIRFFAPSKNIFPFVAIQAGKYQWNYGATQRIGRDQITISSEGESFIGAEAGVWFSKKQRRTGFLLSVGFRSASFGTTAVARYYINPSTARTETTVSNNRQTCAIIKAGFNF